MGYEVLSDDIYEGSSNSPPQKRRKSHSSASSDESSKKFSINPIYLHVGIIVIIVLGLFFYFSEDISFDFKNEEKLTTVSLIGTLENFSYNFNLVDLNLYSAEFILEAQESEFSGKSADFIISNFTGVMYLKNDSMILEGTAQKLRYDGNVFQLKGKNFKLISTKKTNTNVYFENVTLNFVNGRIKLDESLNYEFKNSSIILKQYNSSISYDGTFSFTGHSKEFSLLAPKQHINILYKE